MSQLVDSQALQRVSKTLQLSTPGAQETLFIDERLEQTLDVMPMVRRGLTLAGSEGIYSANMRNTHSGSQGNVTSIVDPWNLGGSARPPARLERRDVEAPRHPPASARLRTAPPLPALAGDGCR